MNSSDEKPRVALLGLGLMGAGMARRLLAAGFPLTVFNRTAARAAPFAAAGARVADSPADAVREAAVVIGMVADDGASRALWLGPAGALAASPPAAVLLESSTLTVPWIGELAAAAAARGLALLDAPVTGSRPQAEAGELNFFVGGEEAALERVRPVLAAMGRSVTRVGPSGSGARFKLVNNFLCGVQAAALAEALALVERAGMDPAQALALLAGGAPGSPLVRTFGARMLAHAYEPNFHLRLMAKDLAYAQREAGARGLELATAAAAHGLFQRAIAAGLADADVSAVIEPLRRDGA